MERRGRQASYDVVVLRDSQRDSIHGALILKDKGVKKGGNASSSITTVTASAAFAD